MNRNSKKGFTIVELIIVIAVIAVLAAVLIPTFSNLIQKANVAADQTLIKNLNTALAMDTDVSKHETMTQALEATKANGFDVEKIVARATKNKIVWDSVNDCFAYIEEGKNEPTYIPDTKTDAKVEDYQLWTIVDSTTLDAKYSSYIAGTSVSGAVETTKGVDVGENTGITAVAYKNEGDKQDVVIRTIGGKLTIEGDNDSVFHFGEASEVDVVKCAMKSYHVYAKVTGTINIQKGRVEIEESGSAAIINVAATNSNDFAVANEKGGKLGIVKAEDPSVISSSNVKVTENTGVMTSEDKDAVAYSEEKGFLKTWGNGVLGNGKTTLLKDLDGGVVHYLQVREGISATFDLNGHTFLTDQSGNSCTYGNLTFMDSSANESGLYYTKVNYSNPDQGRTALKAIGQDSLLIIESGVIEARDGSNTFSSSNGQFGVGVENGGNIIMNGGTIKAGWYAIAGNGSSSGSSTIVINGGKLISVCDYALYLPHVGVTTINGGIIDGAAGAVSVNQGTLVINGGKFSSDGTGDVGDWGDGTGAIGSKSLIMVNGGYGTTSVVINGGTFNVSADYAIVDVRNNAAITISAGIYNKNIDKKWVSTGYTCVKNDDGTWTVVKG